MKQYFGKPAVLAQVQISSTLTLVDALDEVSSFAYQVRVVAEFKHKGLTFRVWYDNSEGVSDYQGVVLDAGGSEVPVGRDSGRWGTFQTADESRTILAIYEHHLKCADGKGMDQ